MLNKQPAEYGKVTSIRKPQLLICFFFSFHSREIVPKPKVDLISGEV